MMTICTTTPHFLPVSLYCSNYIAEVQVLLTVIQMFKNGSRREYRHAAFLTDALSVLEALNSGGEPELADSLMCLAHTQ